MRNRICKRCGWDFIGPPRARFCNQCLEDDGIEEGVYRDDFEPGARRQLRLAA